MKRITSVSGQDLRDMFAIATMWLEKSAADIDALNVFPVPDGDCGTNMLLTMRSAIEEAQRATDHSVSAVTRAMAKGALMGARGNSGVILSQIWRGIAESLQEKESLTSQDLADALVKASTVAYKGLTNPVEGTILTVVRDAATAAKKQVTDGSNDLIAVMEATVNAASDSVANTPTLLAALREAGVVDAGGQGLFTILDGALRYLRGEAEQMQLRRPQLVASSIPLSARPTQKVADTEVPYGYCTEFMLKGEGFEPEKLRKKLMHMGESLIVVGDDAVVRVHIHSLDPGNIIHYGSSLGTLHQISIRNMDEQHRDFLEMQKERAPAVDMATVAVVSGDGLKDVFTSLGASAIVPGGQTMNPSTKELLQAVESVASDKVIILPNNKNVVPAAQQVQTLTGKTVKVVPTETIPQGIAALLAFDYEADFEANARIMEEAKSAVKTIEITRAVRAARFNGLKIKKKQVIAILDGKLLAASDDAIGVLKDVLSKLGLTSSEIFTIYYGADVQAAEAEKVSGFVREQYPHLQIEVIRGGQPYYEYIVSIE